MEDGLLTRVHSGLGLHPHPNPANCDLQELAEAWSEDLSEKVQARVRGLRHRQRLHCSSLVTPSHGAGYQPPAHPKRVSASV